MLWGHSHDDYTIFVLMSSISIAIVKYGTREGTRGNKDLSHHRYQLIPNQMRKIELCAYSFTPVFKITRQKPDKYIISVEMLYVTVLLSES